ncbi:MAG: DUF4412 domain-containing protein [Syntrophobacteraceae bacterium]|nr:DUF4412 domain-containing protein [Syntrophobacteraceae bacterium]
MSHLRLKLLPLVLGLCFLSTNACAGLYWETEIVSAPIPNQPARSTVQRNYYTKNASRVEIGADTVIITDYVRLVMFQLNTANKTYIEVNLASGPSTGGGEMERAEAPTVKPANEVRTIAGYKCRKEKVTFMKAQSEYWVTKDIKGYAEFSDIGANLADLSKKAPNLRQMSFVGMIDVLDGFPVREVTPLLGGNITSTLRKIEQKKLAPELFQVPQNYKLR